MKHKQEIKASLSSSLNHSHISSMYRHTMISEWLLADNDYKRMEEHTLFWRSLAS